MDGHFTWKALSSRHEGQHDDLMKTKRLLQHRQVCVPKYIRGFIILGWVSEEGIVVSS